MHAWVDRWDWLWMTLMMGFWLVVLGAVIFIAVRLAVQQPPRSPRPTNKAAERRSDRPLGRSQA
jgi:hypothetical protein